jgi:hypothetical protein
MYDEITNSDLICELFETADPIGEPHPQHWELMLDAAERIEKLEAQAKKWERLAKEWESAATPAHLDATQKLHKINN